MIQRKAALTRLAGALVAASFATLLAACGSHASIAPGGASAVPAADAADARAEAADADLPVVVVTARRPQVSPQATARKATAQSPPAS